MEYEITTYKIRRADEETICNCGVWLDRGMTAYVVEWREIAVSFACCCRACAEKELARVEGIN